LSRGERSKDIVKDQAKDEEESRSSRAHKIRSYVSNTKGKFRNRVPEP
jgi:hypothetical protein